MADQEIAEPVNEVRLCGRISGEPRRRKLPSGDELVSVRLVVPRPEDARVGSSSGGAGVDTVECVARTRQHQTMMARLASDEHVFITGALRRRFWRAGGSVANVVEVEVAKVERLPAPSADSRHRSPAPSGQ